MDDAGVDGMGLSTFGVVFALVEVAVVQSLVTEVDGCFKFKNDVSVPGLDRLGGGGKLGSIR